MIGTLLQNRYRVDALLGQGGMGAVYHGHDTLLHRDVAIKVLKKAAGIQWSTASRARLLHEAQAAAQLNHANIVSIYDAGEAEISGEGQLPFIVMELLQGRSLFDQRPQSLAEIIAIARQICAALEHAHAHGVIHRDLKPENILVDPDGRVKLTDFGLAYSLSSRLTDEGAIVGSVLYLAPEAALGQAVDGRSDLYSLGVILYELMTGSLPFEAADPVGVISQHLYAPLIPPRARKPELPAALNDLITRLLSKSPDERPASAGEVRDWLEALETAGRVGRVQPPPDWELPALDRLARGRFVGREHELAETMVAWGSAAAGEGGVMLVSGEPGIGKTRLVRELMARAAFSGGYSLFGSCYSEGGIPYAPFPEILVQSLGSSMETHNLPGFVLADLATVAPDLRARFPGQIPSAPLDAPPDQTRIFDSVVTWISALAGRSPVLLFIDDVHWADSGTLYLLRHLARRAHRLRLLIVLTYREIEINDSSALQTVLADFNRERLADRIKLTRFDREQTRAMLSTLLHPLGEIDASLVEAIYRETEGNPFYVEEVTKALIEEGKLCYQEVCWTATDAAEIHIPQSVRLTIQARLARLPAQTQDVLRMAAILGREFDFEILRTASQMEEDTLIDALEKAEQAQIIQELPRRRAMGMAFSFAHAIIPSTLREGVSGLRRQRLHRRAAEAIEAVHPETNSRGNHLEALAYHYEQAGDAPRAQAYYRRAGERALGVYAHEEAERYFRLALELADELGERAPLLAGLGETLFRQSQYEQASDAWQEAIQCYRRLNNLDEVARLYARSGRATWYAGDATRALALCQEGLAAIQPPDAATELADAPGAAALLHETARALRFSNRFEEAMPLCQQALAMARRLGLAEIQAESLATLGILPNQEPGAAQQALLEAIELAESAGLLVVAARANLNLGGHFQGQGKLREGRRYIIAARELARRIGIVAWEFDYLTARLDIDLGLGDLPAIEQGLAELRELFQRIQNPSSQMTTISLMEAYALHSRGLCVEAVQHLEPSLEDFRKLPDKGFLREALNLIGMAYLDMGELEAAGRALSEALEYSGDLKDDHNVAVRVFSAFVHVRQGHPEQARELLTQARQISMANQLPVVEAMLFWGEATLAAAQARWTESLDKYALVYNKFSAFGMVSFQARLGLDWAEALLTRGQPDDRERAEELLGASARIYTAIGAPGYINRINAIQSQLRS